MTTPTSITKLRPAPPDVVAATILTARFPEVLREDDGSAGGPANADSGQPALRPVFDLADFQRDAVARARAVLARRGGVLIADSVGLGKTYMGLALAGEAGDRGEAVLVATPAALRRVWAPGMRRLGRRGTVHWTSHTRLSRGLHDPGALGELGLIVVDEAHAFRNPATRRYRALAELCADARVVLLTATPVNNALADLYALIRLFAHDAAFADLGVPDLRAAFREAAGAVPAARRTPAVLQDPGPVLPVLQDVVIRRTRPFVRDHYGAVRLPGEEGVLRFPRRAPPRIVRYDLLPDGGFTALAHDLAALSFAALAAASGGGRGAGRDRVAAPEGAVAERVPVAELARLGLLKRLESSLAAFRTSAARQTRFHEAFLEALRAGRLLTARSHRADGDGDQLVLTPLTATPLPRGTDPARLARRAEADLARLRRMTAAADRALEAGEGKLAALRRLLEDEAGARVVVFTEFRDTAAHLWRNLAGGHRVGRVDGAGAWLGTERAGRRQVIERFAPRANGAREPPARERVDLLIATDVLAEGLNLQDAARVVCYDLPWNPVRLIQRVGRVDRLGSQHDAVHAWCFTPAVELEAMLGLVARVRAKLATLRAAVGLEAPVLDDTGDADLHVIRRLAGGDPGLLDDIERAAPAPFEEDERLRMALAKWQEGRGPDRRPDGRSGADPEGGGPAAGTTGDPPRPGADEAATAPAAMVRDPEARRPATLVAARIGGAVRWILVDDDGEELGGSGDVLRRAISWEAGGSRLDGDRGTGGRGDVGDVGVEGVMKRAVQVGLRVLGERSRRERVAAQGCAIPQVQGRAARAVLRALHGCDHADPAVVARADAVLHTLARPLPAHVEGRVGDALRGWNAPGTGRPGGLLDSLERALDGAPPGPGQADRRRAQIPEPPRLIGVLRVVPAAGSGAAWTVDRPPPFD